MQSNIVCTPIRNLDNKVDSYIQLYVFSLKHCASMQHQTTYHLGKTSTISSLNFPKRGPPNLMKILSPCWASNLKWGARTAWKKTVILLFLYVAKYSVLSLLSWSSSPLVRFSFPSLFSGCWLCFCLWLLGWSFSLFLAASFPDPVEVSVSCILFL